MSIPVPGTPLGAAVRALFAALAERLDLKQTLRVYLAGGMAVYFYVGKRVSHDLDAEFAGRVLLPANLAVEIEGGEPVYFDTNFNPMFALVHEHYQRDAVPRGVGSAAHRSPAVGAGGPRRQQDRPMGRCRP